MNSDYEFFEFDDIIAMENFVKDWHGKTHGQLREYMSQIKFNSLGIRKFENLSSDEIVSDHDIAIYSLNNYGMVEVKKNCY